MSNSSTVSWRGKVFTFTWNKVRYIDRQINYTGGGPEIRGNYGKRPLNKHKDLKKDKEQSKQQAEKYAEKGRWKSKNTFI